jgi:hypothetical protein
MGMTTLTTRWAAIGAAVAVTLGLGGVIGVEAAGNAAALFVPVTPTRVLDTRDATNIGLTGSFTTDASRKLLVVGPIDTGASTREVVPAGAIAITFNLTVVTPSAGGHVSVRSGDATGVPATSNVNFGPGEVVANTGSVSIPPTGAHAGEIDIFYKGSLPGADTDVLVDITGYYVEGAGLPGPQGETGLQGQVGLTGDTGLQGDTGLTGDAGLQGDTGLTGDAGLTGDTGLQGDTGLTGATGLQGEVGLQGDTGLTGATGLQGEVGLQGDTGLTGATGLQGEVGLQGDTGLTGATGLQGEVGLQGDIGLTGDTGLTGAAGTSDRGLVGVSFQSTVTNVFDQDGGLPVGVTNGDTVWFAVDLPMNDATSVAPSPCADFGAINTQSAAWSFAAVPYVLTYSSGHKQFGQVDRVEICDGGEDPTVGNKWDDSITFYDGANDIYEVADNDGVWFTVPIPADLDSATLDIAQPALFDLTRYYGSWGSWGTYHYDYTAAQVTTVVTRSP